MATIFTAASRAKITTNVAWSAVPVAGGTMARAPASICASGLVSAMSTPLTSTQTKMNISKFGLLRKDSQARRSSDVRENVMSESGLAYTSANARAGAAKRRCAASRGVRLRARSIFANAANASLSASLSAAASASSFARSSASSGETVPSSESSGTPSDSDADSCARASSSRACRSASRYPRPPLGAERRPDAVPSPSPARSIASRGSNARARPQRVEAADTHARVSLATHDAIMRAAGVL